MTSNNKGTIKEFQKETKFFSSYNNSIEKLILTFPYHKERKIKTKAQGRAGIP